MEFQPTINIGTIGHVSHGKSSIVRKVSGVDTVKHSNEKVRGCTIHLGYANAKLFKCDNPDCPKPECYQAHGSEAMAHRLSCRRDGCTGSMELLRHVSFVDCPGHEVLMATMLNGAAIMDSALLVVAASEKCPQPQTVEHLVAAEIMQLESIIIAQNKIDLTTKTSCMDNHQDIKDFTVGTVAENSPVIPVSACHGYNMDILIEHLINLPEPDRDTSSPARMIVIRSFNVNKPGTPIKKLKGGVAGGSILQGVFHVGDKVEIRPGVIIKNKDGSFSHKPIFTEIVSLYSEKNKLEKAEPGGLIGMGTTLDPYLTGNDHLVGQVIGIPDTLPEVYTKLRLKATLLKRLVGSKEQRKISKIHEGEHLQLHIGASLCEGVVKKRMKSIIGIRLCQPVCANIEDKVAISRKISNRCRLIGWGTIMDALE